MHTQLKPEDKVNVAEKGSILLFEREHDLRKAIVLSMLQMDMPVIEASTVEQARIFINDQPSDETLKALILDLDFPEGKSSSLIELFREKSQARAGSRQAHRRNHNLNTGTLPRRLRHPVPRWT